MKPAKITYCPYMNDIHLQGWLYAVELYHFVHFIAKGKARCVEVLYCPDSAQLIQKDQWKQLKDQLSFTKVTSKMLILNYRYQ